ncbi:PPK2 family polyphosphate:nucleotide phosphotransferase [Pedobacter sp. UYP24]
MKITIEDFLAKPGKKIKLSSYGTTYEGKLEKEQGLADLEELKQQLNVSQQKLYASSSKALLVIFQAMDAAGKDSAIEHVFTGVNPQGCEVHSFKAPTSTEYAHDFLWRHYAALPARGKIGIHNRSHYENVLVSKVHPEFLMNEHAEIKTGEENSFWETRYESIRDFEKHISRNGMKVVKIFLHLSKDEQKQRFLDRINDETKNWKFAAGDLKERERWDDYQKAYQQAIAATSTKDCPWYIVPADNKWFARLVIANIVQQSLDSLGLKFPTTDKKKSLAMEEYKRML